MIALLIKYLRIQRLYAKWPVKGVIKLRLLNESISFYSNSDDYLISNYYYRGFDEEISELELLAGMIQDSGVFLDIGSYNGLFSIVLAKKFPNLKVYAFEPHPVNFERTSYNVALNGLENISIHNMGVSDQVGKLDFHIPADFSMTTVSSFDEKFYTRHGHTGSTRQAVDITSLDIFCQENSLSVDMIKIDVEGHETNVFAGARELLGRDRPTILCEIFTRKEKDADMFEKKLPSVSFIDRLLKEMNYEIFIPGQGGLTKTGSLNIDNPGRNLLLKPVDTPTIPD